MSGAANARNNAQTEIEEFRKEAFQAEPHRQAIALPAHAGKRHSMMKRTKTQIRNTRGMVVPDVADANKVRKHYLPYSE